MLLLLFLILADEQREIVEKIYDENRKFFLQVAKEITHSEVCAEDAVSNAFLKIIQNIKQIADLPCHKLIPYCVVIVKNCAIDIIRGDKKYVNGTDDQIQNCLSDAISPEMESINEENALFIRKLLFKLKDDDRKLLLLKYVYGMNYTEISGSLMISEVATRKRCQRALEKLRQLYEENDNENDI